MYPNGTQPLPSLLQAGFSAGQPQTVRILNGVRTGFIVMEGTCVVTIGTATALGNYNDGSLWALFSQVVFYENGTPIVQRDARSMARLTELLGFAPTSAVRFGTTLTAAAYSLRDHLIIPFAWPLAINPWATPFVAQDQNAPNTVGLIAAGAAIWTAAGTATGNGALVHPDTTTTAAITALQINIVQEFDTDLGILPIYRPFMDEMAYQVTANAADQLHYVDYPDILRSFMIQQDSNIGDVADILTAYQFRTDTTLIDGNGTDLPFADQVQQQVRHFGGAISAQRIANNITPRVNPAYLLRNFQSSGRLSNVLVRAQIGQNVRVLATALPSVTAGVTTSTLRYGRDRLQKVQGVTSPGNVTEQGQAIPV